MRQFIFPVLLIVLPVLVAILTHGCTLHENPIGHRIDEPPVVVHTLPPKPDDDGGAR